MQDFNAPTLLGWLDRPHPGTTAAGERWDFRFPSHLDGLAGFNAQLTARLESTRLSPADAFALHLLFDELLTNVIKYAHPEGGEHEVNVQLALDPEQFEICIQDDGVPFDPTTALPAPPADAAAEPVPLEDRAIGGWGLSLVRRTADVLEYRRHGGENHLRLLKRIAPAAPAEGQTSANP